MKEFASESNVRKVLTAAFLWNTFLPEWLHWFTSYQWQWVAMIMALWYAVICAKWLHDN